MSFQRFFQSRSLLRLWLVLWLALSCKVAAEWSGTECACRKARSRVEKGRLEYWGPGMGPHPECGFEPKLSIKPEVETMPGTEDEESELHLDVPTMEDARPSGIVFVGSQTAPYPYRSSSKTRPSPPLSHRSSDPA